VPIASDTDIARMRAALFFEGDDITARLSRFWLLLLLSAVIATAGVVGDSTATVIGAMIVAPLMVPILGTVVAVVLADRANVLRSLALVVAGASAVIAIAYVLGLLVGSPVTAANNSQVAARVTPNLVDLVAALATGAVGSVALARDDISDTLPGVAIAISLVPPLAVVGLSLESGEPGDALGAFLLFVANVSAILVTGLLVMSIYRVHRLATGTESARAVHRRRAAAVIVLALVLVAIPLTAVSVQLRRINSTQNAVSHEAERWADEFGWEIISVDVDTEGVVVRAVGPLPEPETEPLQRAIAAAGYATTPVTVELVPSYIVTFGGSGEAGGS
jgi:uncharacterized hydrophobic protein (TIGR00271 family)